MGKVLIIGCGGVGTVVAHKCAQNPDVFEQIVIASRTKSKCDAVAKAIGAPNITTDAVDADSVPQLVELFKKHRPDIVINVALPYQDLTIMDACLECGVNYLDTANYEPRDEAHFEYSWQWAYRERFEKAGLTAILGCGFDPGVTSVYTAYAAKHHFKEIQYLDIVDCNAGNHHKAFATNFNPEINIREITQKGLYWENGKWVKTEPLEIHQPLTYPEIGPRESYLLHHEEIESLVLNYPTIKRARFWMTFGQQYLTYLDCIQNLGMSRIDEIEYSAPLADNPDKTVKVKIVPLQFLKAVLPNPQDLGSNYDGQTSIGCRIRGIGNDGKELTYYIYNNCSHEAAYKETGMQGVSYTTGVPAMTGAMMFLKGIWNKPGVHNVEEFDPDPFLDVLNKQGLPWHEIFNCDLEL
ncbi:MAG: saccharopine dehydrogenase family protein [bacterium]|nr:saccharopine dehydrogenase family protein [bacterium]